MYSPAAILYTLGGLPSLPPAQALPAPGMRCGLARGAGPGVLRPIFALSRALACVICAPTDALCQPPRPGRQYHCPFPSQRVQRVCTEEAHGYKRAAAGACGSSARACLDACCKQSLAKERQRLIAAGAACGRPYPCRWHPCWLARPRCPPAARLPAPQNFFLYFFGFCFNALGLLFVMAVDGSMRPGTLLHGFRAVRLQAAGRLPSSTPRTHAHGVGCPAVPRTFQLLCLTSCGWLRGLQRQVARARNTFCLSDQHAE